MIDEEDFSGISFTDRNTINAQDDSTGSSLTMSGYAEAYYCYDLNKPSDNSHPGFIYSQNRHDHNPTKNVLVRLEAGSFNSKDGIFHKRNEFVKSNTFIASFIAVSF